MVFNPDLVISAETLDGRVKLWALAEAVLILNGVLNSITEDIMALITEFSVGIHLIGTVVIFVYLLAAAPIHQ